MARKAFRDGEQDRGKGNGKEPPITEGTDWVQDIFHQEQEGGQTNYQRELRHIRIEDPERLTSGAFALSTFQRTSLRNLHECSQEYAGGKKSNQGEQTARKTRVYGLKTSNHDNIFLKFMNTLRSGYICK